MHYYLVFIITVIAVVYIVVVIIVDVILLLLWIFTMRCVKLVTYLELYTTIAQRISRCGARQISLQIKQNKTK